ncbi:MAG: hypothetical protein ACLFOY_03950 [Desulfatibacillaceae bacterium]
MHKDHGRPHSHSHDDQPASAGLTTRDKLVTLLEHWKNHNVGHAGTYRQWAKRAAAEGLDEVAALLDEAAEMNTRMNEKFDEAAKKLEK